MKVVRWKRLLNLGVDGSASLELLLNGDMGDNFNVVVVVYLQLYIDHLYIHLFVLFLPLF